MIWDFLAVLQTALAARVAHRFVKTARGQKIETSVVTGGERVSVILPVLNEAPRITACLDSLLLLPETVAEILVVDGGSDDATRSIVGSFQARDCRIRWIDATPIGEQWTGKAWGLYVGLQRTSEQSGWVLCVDADVRCSKALVDSLLNQSRRGGLAAVSVATTQRLTGAADALFHPAFLSTLVYRFGAPGRVAEKIHEVQANGQCLLIRRDALMRTQAVVSARGSLCEDMTIARRLVEGGERVGFYLSDNLVEVNMYGSWRETWQNWPRSLALRDQYFGWRGALGLAEILLVQALPLPGLVLGFTGHASRSFIIANLGLLLMRIGVLAGMAPAYPSRPWSYWLSPLLDLPVALRLIESSVKKHQVWRGRCYIRRNGRFELLTHSAGTAKPR